MGQYAKISFSFCMVSLLSNNVAAQEQTSIRLTDVSQFSGVNFVHTDGGTGKRYIVESVVAGLATLDFDGDGYMDIYFVNGSNLDGTGAAEDPGNALYRNNGDFTFTDVTAQAGVETRGYGMGVVAAD